MLTFQALTYIETHNRTSRIICNYATDTPRFSKRSDTMLNWIALYISTVKKSAPVQVVKQPGQWKASTTKEKKSSSFQMNYD